MLNLLKIEWLKVRHYRAFWVFVILYFVSIAGINYIGFYINEVARANVPVADSLIGSPYSFPRVWSTVGFMSSWLLYFPGFLFIMLLTNEFNFKTHRQNIIDGWERKDFINVKFLFAFIFSVVATLFNLLVALSFGLAAKNSGFSWDEFYNVGFILIQTFSYISFAMLMAVIFRRSGVALAVFFLYGLIFESIFGGLLNGKLQLSPAGYYLPLQVTDSLMPLPFGKNLFYTNMPDNWILVTVSVAYMGLYYFLSLRKFQRDDL